MMNVLDSDILKSIFGEWLEIPELQKLDSALCNHCDRLIFLSLLSCNHFIPYSSPKEYRILSGSYFSWLAVRQIQAPKDIILDFFNDHEDNFALNEHVVAMLERIKDKNLRYLSFQFCSNLDMIVNQYVSNISQLNLSSSKHMNDDQLINLLSKIRGVTDLDISLCSKLTGECLSKIVAMFPDLKALHFQDVEDGWEATSAEVLMVARSCKNIEEF